MKRALVGISAHANTEPSDGTAASSAYTEGKTNVNRPASLSALTITTIIAFQVRWEDIVHIDVTKASSELQWTYDGWCAYNASGTSDWWWRSGTG